MEDALRRDGTEHRCPTNVAGHDPGAPREQYQLRHNAQADSSACQAKGSTWGVWTNANTANNYCSYWCGVRHDYSTGQATTLRPGRMDSDLTAGGVCVAGDLVDAAEDSTMAEMHASRRPAAASGHSSMAKAIRTESVGVLSQPSRTSSRR